MLSLGHSLGLGKQLQPEDLKPRGAFIPWPLSYFYSRQYTVQKAQFATSYQPRNQRLASRGFYWQIFAAKPFPQRLFLPETISRQAARTACPELLKQVQRSH